MENVGNRLEICQLNAFLNFFLRQNSKKIDCYTVSRNKAPFKNLDYPQSVVKKNGDAADLPDRIIERMTSGQADDRAWRDDLGLSGRSRGCDNRLLVCSCLFSVCTCSVVQ